MTEDPRAEARRRIVEARRELASALADTQTKVERVTEPVRAVREKGWILPAAAGALGLGIAYLLRRRR